MDESTILAGLRAAPDDLTATLLYADWLEERGEANYELLRVWCQLKQCSHTDKKFLPLLIAYRELFAFTSLDWLRALGEMRPWVDRQLAAEIVSDYLTRGGEYLPRTFTGTIECQRFEEGWKITHQWTQRRRNWQMAFGERGPVSATLRSSRSSREAPEQEVLEERCYLVDESEGKVFTLNTPDEMSLVELRQGGYIQPVYDRIASVAEALTRLPRDAFGISDIKRGLQWMVAQVTGKLK